MHYVYPHIFSRIKKINLNQVNQVIEKKLKSGFQSSLWQYAPK